MRVNQVAQTRPFEKVDRAERTTTQRQRDVLDQTNKKDEPESSGRGGCFKSICDFLCSIFRFLFCMSKDSNKPDKQKVNEQSIEEMVSAKRSSQPQVVAGAEYFFQQFVPNMEKTTSVAFLRNIKDETIQDYVFYLLVSDERYDVLDGCLEYLALERKAEFEKQYGCLFSPNGTIDKPRLQRIFLNGLSPSEKEKPAEQQSETQNTQQQTQPIETLESLKEEVGIFLTSNYGNLLGSIPEFLQKEDRVQDAILAGIAAFKKSEILNAYVEASKPKRQEAFYKAWAGGSLEGFSDWAELPGLVSIFEQGLSPKASDG